MSLHTGPIDIRRMVKRVRERHDFTQQALAELLGVHAITVSRWESGQAEQMAVPTRILLYILAHADEAAVAEARREHERKRR